MHYIQKFCKINGIAQKGYTPEFLEILSTYDWPGNVREFINTMERVVIEAYNEKVLYPRHTFQFWK